MSLYSWVRMVVSIRKGEDSSLFGAEIKKNLLTSQDFSNWSDNTKETTKEDLLPNTSFITQTYSYYKERKHFACFLCNCLKFSVQHTTCILFFLIYLFYLFIFGCIGSSLLCAGFL